MDGFLDTYLGEWKLGVIYTTQDGIRYHRNSHGGVTDCWRPEERLGIGAHGDVWKEKAVYPPSLSKVRAVKKINKEQTNFIQSSQRELHALTTFSGNTVAKYQKCFVQFLGWFEDADHLYIAMEFMPNGDLQRYLNEETFLTEPEAAVVTRQVATALQYMHTNGFAHRDLKPSNILISSKGPSWHVKLADFGISTNATGAPVSTEYIRTSGYIAPELVDTSEIYTAAVDVWALGAVVFCMLTGAPPFQKLDDMLGYCAKMRQFPTRSLRTSTGMCIDLVLGAMEPVPAERLSVSEVLEHEWLAVKTPIASQTHRVLNPGPLPRLYSPSIRLPSFRVLPEPPQSGTLLEVSCLTASIHVSKTLASTSASEVTVAQNEGQAIKKRTNKARQSQPPAGSHREAATLQLKSFQERIGTKQQISNQKTREERCDELHDELLDTMVDKFLQHGDLNKPMSVRLDQLFLVDDKVASQQPIPGMPDIICIFCRQPCPGIVEGLQHLKLKHGLKIPTSLLNEGLTIQSRVQRSAQH